MQIGKFRITPIEFGEFRLDGGAMFGVIPRIMWEKFHPPDENNTIKMVMRCLLIETEEKKILVDTGFGEGRADKFKNIFSFKGEGNFMDSAVTAAGLKCSDITDVILTHLHFDHAGGSTINKASSPTPTFPNANYYIQKNQLDHARSLFERDKASYMRVDFEPLIDAGVAVIVDGKWQLMSGIECLVCNGHTPGMQLPIVKDQGRTLIYGADLIPLASQISLPWIMGYDLYPVTTLTEKKHILSRAAEEDWVIFFEHDPLHITGQVVKTDRGFALRNST